MGYKGEKYVNEMASGKLLIIIDNGIKNAFSAHGKRCVDALKALILGGTRSGRMYMYNGRRYQASAPGEPPANRSGRLANSNDFVARSKELAIFNTAFANKAPYPFFLEEGTKKMAARAWFEKTMIRLEPLLYQSLLGIKI
jgi:hypothetical protein